MSTIKQAVRKLEGIRSRLLKPRLFYESNLDDWRALASKTATDLLLNARPLNTEPEMWAKQVRITANRISASMVSRAYMGVVIRMATREDSPEDDEAFNVEFGFGMQDVERWIAAGMEKTSPDEPGKNLDNRDAGKDIRQIAWTVLTAIKNGNKGASGLTAAISKFLASEGDDIASGLYPDILAAWVDVIGVRAVQDWRAWVKAQIA